MAINTRADFLNVLRRSELLGDEMRVVAAEATTGLTEPTAVARKLVQKKLLTRWQAGQLLAGQTSLSIGKYRLLDMLDRTLYGPVYLAKHAQMDRQVVLKTLARRDTVPAEAIHHFLDEARALAGLDHRNLSHVYDVDREGGLYYLVMEHVAGRTLREIVEHEGPLTCRAASSCIAKAASALAHAHEHGIEHRGITPTTLLMDESEEVKVVDLGFNELVRASGSSDCLPDLGDDAQYLAPEQLTQSSSVGPRSDIYSLGCVFYYLLTGMTPFDADDDEAGGGPEGADPRKQRSDVPETVAGICRKMIALAPDDRYSSAAEVVEDLNEWLETLETTRAETMARASRIPPRPPVAGSRSDAANRRKPPRPERPKTRAVTRAQRRPSHARFWMVVGVLGLLAVGLVIVIVAVATSQRRGVARSESAVDAPREETPPVRPPKQKEFSKPSRAPTTGPPAESDKETDRDRDVPVKEPMPAKDPPTKENSVNQSADKDRALMAKAEEAAKLAAAARSKDTARQFHPLQFVSFTSTPPVRHLQLPDESILVLDPPEAEATYVVEMRTVLPSIDGIRLEALADRRLPGSGPGFGGGSSPGEFTLTKFTATATPDQAKKPTQLKLHTAVGSFSEQGFDVAGAIAAGSKTGWSIGSKAGEGHWALFMAQPPVKGGKETVLKIHLVQPKGKALGRFRLSAITGTTEGADPGADLAETNRSARLFSQLNEAADLPELPEDTSGEASSQKLPEPVVLGKVVAAPGVPVYLRLLGGGTAGEGTSEFRLRAVDASGEGQQWDVEVPAPGAQVLNVPVIASFSLDGQDLKFQWREQALTVPAANYLRNFVLEVVAAGERHGVALRTPVEASPIDLGLSKPARAAYKLPWPPNTDAMKLELMPKNRKLFAEVLEQPFLDANSLLELTLSEAGEPRLVVTLRSTTRQGLQLSTTAYYYYGERRISLDRDRLGKLFEQRNEDLKTIRGEVERLKSQPTSPKAKQAAALQKIISGDIKGLTALLKRVDLVQEAGPVPFQAYFTVGTYRLVLVKSSPPQPRVEAQ